jgi:hypothetical protein
MNHNSDPRWQRFFLDSWLRAIGCWHGGNENTFNLIPMVRVLDHECGKKVPEVVIATVLSASVLTQSQTELRRLAYVMGDVIAIKNIDAGFGEQFNFSV